MSMCFDIRTCFSAFFRQSDKQPKRSKSVTFESSCDTFSNKMDDPRKAVIKRAAEMREDLRIAARRYFSATSPLTDQEEKWMTDEILGIYVRARQTPAERLDILIPAMKWRIANRTELKSRSCPYCVANPLSHDARLFGFDLEGDFVFMNCFQLPHDISVDSVTRHMTCLMESALAEYPSSPSIPLGDDGHPKARQWTFIFDLHGFGLRYYDPRVTLRLLELFQVVHRARVKKFFVLDSPSIFWGFWNMVKPFMNADTAAKIVFSNWERSRRHLEKEFGTPLAAELLDEAMENRDPNRVACKRWTTFYGSSLHQARTRNLMLKGS